MFVYLLQISLKRLQVILVSLFIATTVMGQLPTAQEIAKKMKVGWNLGNTLEAICSETAWGNPKTTQRLIDSVKAAGFNTIRLPVAWFCRSDTIENIIDADWLERVKEVVDYCINDSMYVIINAHWDLGWLENRVNAANQNQVNVRQHAFWTQIAEYFKNYGEHLLFAGSNEPHVENAEGMAILLSYHQTFINAVRATGGNNASRTLIIQGPSTDIDKTYQLMNTLPIDQIENRLMVEIHYYTPYQFCLMTSDASWGKMFYYWGKNYHSKFDVERNATWGEEADVEKYFKKMKTKFFDKGIPVILGEFLAIKRSNQIVEDFDLHVESRLYFHKYIVAAAIRNGMIPYYWDTGDYSSGIFNRTTGEVKDRDNLNAIMEGAKTEKPSNISFKQSTIDIFPNPFTSSFTIIADNPHQIQRITISDMMGKIIKTIDGKRIKIPLIIGDSLKSNVYTIKVIGYNWSESFKIIKL